MSARRKSLSRVRLGPVELPGGTVVLRPPRLDDFARWRALRLRDQRYLEPFWGTLPLDWHARHSERMWVHELLTALTQRRAGRALAMVIEVDGRFTGQCELGSIDTRMRSAELSIWLDSAGSSRGIKALAVALLVDFGFEELGLHRITAPISPDNAAATHGAVALGLVREARMARYFDIGGARRDHDLWAITRTTAQPGEFRNRALRLAARDEVGRNRSTATEFDVPTAVLRPEVVLTAAARWQLSRLSRPLRSLRVGPAVRVTAPERPEVALRSRTLSDAFTPHTRGDSPARRMREYLCTRRGLSSSVGLVLAIELAGTVVGTGRVFGLDMFDRNAQIQVRMTSAVPDDDVRIAALRRMIELSFDDLGLYRLSMSVETGDRDAALIAEAAGLLHEGTMRDVLGPNGYRADHDLWALTIEQYR